MLSLRIIIFIFFRFGAWNKEVSLTPGFQRVKITPPLQELLILFFHVREHLEWWAANLFFQLFTICPKQINNMPEVFGQHEISQTVRVFSSILENISVGFSKMPFLQKNPKFPQAAQKFVLI
jgi:hypothetical protein